MRTGLAAGPGDADGPGGPTEGGGPTGGIGRLQRLVPTALRGPGRRAAWQRTRLRRVLAAGLVASAVWLAVSAFLPQPVARGGPVVVVAQDLMAGHVLARGDLAITDWPADLRPAGTVADPGPLVGRALGAGMSHGEAVTEARVRGPGLLGGVPDGFVAAHVRLTDPAMAAMTTAGDHVDLISLAGKLVASDITVLAVDAAPGGSGRWSASAEPGSPGGVIVAVTREAALRLATAEPSGLSDGTFSLVLRAPAT